jgi:hypothetical protein
MTDLLFLAGFLVLPLIGSMVWRVDEVRALDRAGQMSIAGAIGAVIVAVTMALLSLVGVEWSRTLLVGLFGLLAMIGMRAARHPALRFAQGRPVPTRWAEGLLLVLLAYGALTARVNAGDLHYFWGPKGIGFFYRGGIETAFMTAEGHAAPDAPPLLPVLFAWAQTLSHQFSWWSATLVSVLCVAACAAVLRATSEDDRLSLLLTATLTWAFASAYTVGGADPLLLVFETVVLCAVLFLPQSRGIDLVIAACLAGAAFTKIEGTTFVIAIAIALVLMKRQFKRAILISIPALLIVGAWVFYAANAGFLLGYGGTKMPMHFELIPRTIFLVLKHASYGLFWLPWVGPLLLIGLAPQRRNALIPAIVAVLAFAALIYYYIHATDPEWWITHSAARVLLTPLTSLVIGAAAAWRQHPI